MKVQEQVDPDLDLIHYAAAGGGESRTARYHTGTKALMLAVLDNAIEGLFSHDERCRIEAEHWITSCLRRSPFSFVVVCETLGLDPDAARIALRRQRTQGVTRPDLGRRRADVGRRLHPTRPRRRRAADITRDV